MAKQRTPNSGYISRNDVATDSFYADYQENLGIADAMDAELAAATADLIAAVGASNPGSIGWLEANVNNVE